MIKQWFYFPQKRRRSRRFTSFYFQSQVEIRKSHDPRLPFGGGPSLISECPNQIEDGSKCIINQEPPQSGQLLGRVQWLHTEILNMHTSFHSQWGNDWCFWIVVGFSGRVPRATYKSTQLFNGSFLGEFTIKTSNFFCAHPLNLVRWWA